MSNRYVKNSQITATKFRQILKLFASDAQGKLIAKFTGISERAINRLLDKLRKRIALLAEKESCFTKGEIEIDESYFGPRRVKGKRGRGAAKKKIVFGVKKRDGKVYTQIVKNCSTAELLPIIKRLVPKESVLYSDEWKAYDSLVDAGYKQHYRIKHSNDVFANGKVHINSIESFWGVAKIRLAKFRGIRHNKFCLYLKETEFRFNHREENLYAILLKELRKTPL